MKDLQIGHLRYRNHLALRWAWDHPLLGPELRAPHFPRFKGISSFNCAVSLHLSIDFSHILELSHTLKVVSMSFDRRVADQSSARSVSRSRGCGTPNKKFV